MNSSPPSQSDDDHLPWILLPLFPLLGNRCVHLPHSTLGWRVFTGWRLSPYITLCSGLSTAQVLWVRVCASVQRPLHEHEDRCVRQNRTRNRNNTQSLGTPPGVCVPHYPPTSETYLLGDLTVCHPGPPSLRETISLRIFSLSPTCQAAQIT